MLAVSIGDKYPHKIPSRDGTQYSYEPATGHRLVLFYSRPTPGEIDSVTNGQADFALAIEDGVIFLLARFGGEGSDWMSAPFSIHLAPEGERGVPEPGPMELTTALVDRGSMRLVALRKVILAEGFGSAVAELMAMQDRADWQGREAHFAAIQRVMERFPSDAALSEAALFRARVPAREKQDN